MSKLKKGKNDIVGNPNMRFSVHLHPNIKEFLVNDGLEPDPYYYYFDTIDEAWKYDYPMHRDNYSITEYGDWNSKIYNYDVITSVSMGGMNGDEKDLSEYIIY